MTADCLRTLPADRQCRSMSTGRWTHQAAAPRDRTTEFTRTRRELPHCTVGNRSCRQVKPWGGAMCIDVPPPRWRACLSCSAAADRFHTPLERSRPPRRPSRDPRDRPDDASCRTATGQPRPTAASTGGAPRVDATCPTKVSRASHIPAGRRPWCCGMAACDSRSNGRKTTRSQGGEATCTAAHRSTTGTRPAGFLARELE